MPIQLTFDELIKRLTKIRSEVLKADQEFETLSKSIHHKHYYNAKNFLRYLKFRTFDLRKIQANLASLGLSSLSHSERHVLANIENILYLLNAHLDKPFKGKSPFGEHPANFIDSGKRLKKNTHRLFGKHIRKMGIMVTLSPKATEKEHMLLLLKSGMNVARINSAHDDIDTWKQMISKLQECCAELDKKCSLYIDLAGQKIRLEDCIAPKEALGKKHPVIQEGDEIILAASLTDKRAKALRKEGKMIFSCSQPSVLADVKPTQRIWFDDGSVGGEILETDDGFARIRINSAEGGKMRLGKGINLPDTKIELPALSKEDLENLDFISREADMIGFSFVRIPDDIRQLQDELKTRGYEKKGIILKVENRQAFDNLPELILQALSSPVVGVMTARGDLAVEMGSERLSEVQEEIMWLCEAAMIPNIWATQVLQSLVKKGKINRAEITDSAMSVRAECVMLNKGPHIFTALSKLKNILGRMDKHVYKKLGTLRSLHVAEKFWEGVPIPEDSSKKNSRRGAEAQS